MLRGLLSLLLFLPAAVSAQAPNLERPLGYFNDYVDVMASAQKVDIEERLSAFAQETGHEVVVAVVPDLGGDTIENFAVKLFEKWGIGKKGADNGVLILVAIAEREMRIEVGYGLEGALTDIQSNAIINEIMKPAFQAGDFYNGIKDGAAAVMSGIRGEEIVYANQSSSSELSRFYTPLFFFLIFWLASILGATKSWWLGGVLGGVIGVIVGLIYGFIFTGLLATGILIIIGLLFDFVVSRMYEGRVHSGHGHGGFWGGGGFGGGGFGGFGGGSSGGGGSSSRW